MTDSASPRSSERRAHLRFSIIGSLLAAPPAAGQLKAEIEILAEKTWLHPVTGKSCRFAFSTIEHRTTRGRRHLHRRAGSSVVGCGSQYGDPVGGSRVA